MKMANNGWQMQMQGLGVGRGLQKAVSHASLSLGRVEGSGN